jgi:hypothetical protein
VELAENIMLRLGQFPQLHEQRVLPGGDAAHPPETDDSRARSEPCYPARQPVYHRRLLHTHLAGHNTAATLPAPARPLAVHGRQHGA